MDDPPPPLISFPFSIDYSHARISPDTAHILTKFLKNSIYISTVPLSFETYREDIYTTHLIREHQDSYLYNFDTQSLVETPHEPSFSIAFTSFFTSNETFRINMYPNNIYVPTAHVLTTFLENLSGKIISYLNMLSLPLLYKHFVKKKLILIFLILNNFALSSLSLAHYRYPPNPPLSKPIFSKSVFEYTI